MNKKEFFFSFYCQHVTRFLARLYLTEFQTFFIGLILGQALDLFPQEASSFNLVPLASGKRLRLTPLFNKGCIGELKMNMRDGFIPYAYD